MLDYILIFLLGLSIVPSLFGLLVIYHVFIRGKTAPADKSNRVNHLRLVWFALTREEEFVDKFEWLKNDEWENFQEKNREG